ncbi:diphosphomevalonate decarboxylase [Fructilactobacillus cliffordii]|uniref:diphosphomevalonate decarboxylase n=1 Tax=Fructilactobacillus cliffordii TaxID=2940299 RepID=UPI00209390C9|nr:diphosphomevalonate decarboxylase [Fructilactobacillus cliffordii]USS86672.1 diphosphomevalonate decarboxylase [Fructilactobacillus cliffordii]
MNNYAKARAHTNIALVKYWGKINSALKLPTTSSLSLTLDQFYTDTSVQFNETLTNDQVTFNERRLNERSARRITDFLDLVRNQAGITTKAVVQTTNNVPTAAGLASSASGFAALAAAASKASGLRLNHRELSRMARRGSGSATRSIDGGFVEWHKGIGDRTSFATQVAPADYWDLNVIAILVNQQPKKMSSSEGMQLSQTTSPYYHEWEKLCQRDLKKLKIAIKNHNFNDLGNIAEENAMRMHALTLSAAPDFCYFDADSLKAMRIVHQLRESGIPCYFTMDAGPNVKVLVEPEHRESVVSTLQTAFGPDNIVVAAPGPGVQYLT